MFLGSRGAAAPYVVASKIATLAYFLYFLVVLPGVAALMGAPEVTISKFEFFRDKGGI